MKPRLFPLKITAAFLAFALNPAQAQLPTNGLVAHWNFDNYRAGTPINNAFQNQVTGGSALHGTLQGTLVLPAAPISIDQPYAGAGLSFYPNGTGEENYALISNPVLANYDADHSVSAWFKADNAPSGSTRYVVYESQEFVLSLGLREDANNNSRTLVQFFSNITTGNDPVINVSLIDGEIAGQWIHTALVFERDGSTRTMTAYINGLERGSTTFTTALDLSPNPDFFLIGKSRLGPPNDRFFKGLIDDVAIWDRSLSAGEIAALANPSYDVNDDGILSISDFAAVEAAARYDSTNLDFDLNGNGTVDQLDSLLLVAYLVTDGEFKTVDTLADDGSAGSLRTILENAKASPGTHITFAPGIAGGTITLGSDQLTVPAGKEVYIDGGDAGITIDANGEVTNHRVMAIGAGGTVALYGLEITGGNASAVGLAGRGGGIFNDKATLSLIACTLSNNSATSFGGGIYNDARDGGSATLNLNACTLFGNSSQSNGGGICADSNFGGNSFLNLRACTLSSNSSGGSGGGISSLTSNSGIARIGMDASTLSENSATAGGGFDFAGDGSTTTTLTFRNSIIAANNAPTGPDFRDRAAPSSSTIILNGNLIGDNSGSDVAAVLGFIGTSAAPIAPHLAPLGDYGGPTHTHPPLIGSPAINGAPTSTATADQRGFAITDGEPDIGAVEVQTGDNIQVTTTEDRGPGSLRQALAEIPIGGVISFDPALSGKTITLTTGELTIAQPLAVVSTGLPAGITFSGGGASRVFNVSGAGDLTLHGLTIAEGNGGAAPQNGGGIQVSFPGCLTMIGCTIRDCTAPCGGAITNSGTVLLEHCTISRNHASGTGGVVCNGNPGIFTMKNSTASGNTSPAVGGVRIFGGTVHLENNILAGNGNDLGGSPVTDINNLTNLDPQLAPLGHYGGPTQTMHPLAGSPAIGTGSSTRTDQRGFTLTGPPTIGAVKLGPVFTVDHATDEIDGVFFDDLSLREAIIRVENESPQGAVIRFKKTTLDGSTITLGSGQNSNSQLTIPGTIDGLFIDASDLASGLTIDANGEVTNHRVMEIKKNATAALHGLTLTGGNAPGSFPTSFGGAIFSDGRGSGTLTRLSLSACTLSGNSADDDGGAICSFGPSGGSAALSLHGCTFSGNSAARGGGVLSSGQNGSATLTVHACTLSGNSAASSGGGIFSDGRSGTATLNLYACTLSRNSAANDGGGIFSHGRFGTATLNLNDTILAGNTSAIEPDLSGIDATNTQTGNNLVGTTAAPIDPNLAPLDHYGGPTQTMPPIPGSPAIDAATTSTSSADQRGFAITDGSPDIGAVEFRGASDLAFLWEIDHDNDGTAFGIEFALGTNPFLSDPENPAHMQVAPNAEGDSVITFGYNPDAVGYLRWVIQNSNDLVIWNPLSISSNPAGPTSLTEESNDPNAQFYRFEAVPIQE